MATNAELFAILSFTVAGSTELLQRVGVATLITAYTIASGNDNDAPFDQTAGMHEKRMIWASQVFQHPRGLATSVLPAVVAANAGATQAQILNATDSAIQANVDAIADVFAAVVTLSV